ncbi:MAG: hypothetical protein JJU11_08080 [Candidatus Sumerlaeia bacterium]|nr:hypothetical protein [Candidatus Sumerlaeia bacterium]
MTAILEGYDNEFLLRSDEPGVGRVRVWYHESSGELLHQVLVECRTHFPVTGVEFLPGMAGLDDIYPDET